MMQLYIFAPGPGPNNWKAACAYGKSQSPIDVPKKNLKKQFYNPFIFHGYDKDISSAKITNDGHSIKLTPGDIQPNIMPSVRINLRKIQNSKILITQCKI